jgi:ketosteroid isomerase-like protein
MAKPYRIHFDFSGASIYSTPEIAWAFSNKTIVIEAEMGEKTTSAYRLTSVWVKRGNKWKLKLFNGSVPEKR